MKKRLFMSFVGLILCIGLAVAQVSKVAGTVTSAETGEPIIGATVLVEGTTTGSITDIDGKFAIANIPANAKNLMVSYVGMKTMRVAIQAGELKIELRPDTEVLDEVVVTAMGISREKKALGYALQEVKSDQITQAATMNVANALSGKVAGVQITSQGGQIGASQNIVIRGNSSFGNNAPLIVVDGVPIQNDNGTGSAINLGSGMNDINPEDIESISVLKGGSAALYGMRAGNGVVLITTKNGKKNKGVRVSYDGSFTVDQIYNLPKLQNKYGQGYYGSEYDWVESGAKASGMSYAEFAEKHGYSYYDGMGNGVNDNADESWGPRLDIGLMLPQFDSPVVDGVRQKTPWVSQPNNIKDFFQLGSSQNHELDKIFVQNQDYKNLFITILSFGFKYGIPADSDLVFDVRFLPNPYYVEGLRAKTGNDREIQNYVLQFQEAHEFLKKLEDMLNFLVPNYIAEGKNQLVISIGCTGGKHRSVTLANEIYRRLSVRKEYGIKIEHRDITKDALRGK